MIFTESRFLVFFAVVFALHWTLRPNWARKSVLLVASYVFYAAWDWRFLFLILGSTIIDYLVGWRLGASRKESVRRAWLVTSLIANLGILGFFKYFDFFVESGAGLLNTLGLDVEPKTLGLVLPVGISFFTFQTMSYTIDVHRRAIEPVRNPLDFALFVAFFPQLVAGPIVRASTFLPQLIPARRYSDIRFRAAAGMFLIGFIKKACIADQLAGIIDPVFASPESFDATAHTLAVLGYTTQLYCDFSGYSDMAIACGLLLGFALPENFRWPYFAQHIGDFWRRWHVSLSYWFRDYFFIPLGGSRVGLWRTRRNLMLTMTLCGLWHGAGWNFLVFGFCHGAGLIGHQIWAARSRWSIPAPIGVLMTVGYFATTLIIFRTGSMDTAVALVEGVFLRQTEGAQSLPAHLWIVLAGLYFVHWLGMHHLHRRIADMLPDPLFALGLGILAALALTMVPLDVRPFVYFQF